MNAGLIKQKFDVDELELYDYIIQIYCVLNKTSLPVSERNLLTYYIRWGISKEAEEKFNSDFKRSRQIVGNLKTSLKNKGFITKNDRLNIWELPSFLNQRRNKMIIMLQFDASK